MTDEKDDRPERRKNKKSGTFDPVPVDLPTMDLPDVPNVVEVSGDVVDDAAEEIEGMVRGVRPDTDRIEAAISEVRHPDIGGLDADVEPVPDVDVSPEDADVVLEEGGEVVSATVDRTGEAATVVVDAGGEAVEVVVEGSEAAGEVAVEVAGEVVAGTFAALLEL